MWPSSLAVFPGVLTSDAVYATTNPRQPPRAFYRLADSDKHPTVIKSKRIKAINTTDKSKEYTCAKTGERTAHIPFRDLYLGADEGRGSFAVYDKKRHGPHPKSC